MLHYQMTLSLGQDRISGSGGCNHYTGKISTTPGLLFENIMSGQMACLREDGKFDYDLMEAEENFISILSDANEMDERNDSLKIFSGSGDELRFAREGGCR
jgi:heat shock protein HslJ